MPEFRNDGEKKKKENGEVGKHEEIQVVSD